LPQTTIDSKGKVKQITIRGRHDPCLVPRIVPVAEAMVNLVLADLLLQRKGG
jgi:chorismate synthase